MTDGPDIRVAKITSFQAIAVAMITAVAGIVGTLLATHHSDPGSRWRKITIDQLTYNSAEPKTAIRLIVECNGQAYSYPSRTLWADIGGNISQESFPLPPSTDGYHVHFEAYLRHPNGKIDLLQSQAVDSITNPAVPFTGNYQLHPVDEGFTRGITSPVAIGYRVD
jgi:hypothetical protein